MEQEITKKVIKRNGSEVDFDARKIKRAIEKANGDVAPVLRMNERSIEAVTLCVAATCSKLDWTPNVEDIQEMVENELMRHEAYEVAKAYIRYRYEHELRRKGNTIDGAVLSLVNYDNEEIKQENSNKNPAIIPTQRDYIAGEVSKDITNRLLLPKEIVEADKEGIIHFHDRDYFIQRSHNCDLVNLDDMLQNGTVISVMI